MEDIKEGDMYISTLLGGFRGILITGILPKIDLVVYNSYLEGQVSKNNTASLLLLSDYITNKIYIKVDEKCADIYANVILQIKNNESIN